MGPYVPPYSSCFSFLLSERLAHPPHPDPKYASKRFLIEQPRVLGILNCFLFLAFFSKAIYEVCQGFGYWWVEPSTIVWSAGGVWISWAVGSTRGVMRSMNGIWVGFGVLCYTEQKLLLYSFFLLNW